MSSRPSRSRVSSPFVPGSKTTMTEGAKSAKENPSSDASAKDKTFMDRWIEPERPTPRPSFAEAGLERHNVLLNMAPLGTLPSSKVRRGAEGMGRLAKSTAPSTPTPVESEPASETPQPEQQPEQQIEQRRQSVSTNKTEEKLDEVVASPLPSTPVQVLSPRKSVSRQSLPPPPGSGQSVFAVQPSPIPNNTPNYRPVSSSYAPQAQMVSIPPRPSMSNFGTINFDLCDRVVEKAVQEALDESRYPTAYALRTLFDDHRSNIRIVRLIESIYYESATDEQRVEFNSIMKHKKKEGQKDRTAEYYFNGDGSDPAPARPPITQTVSAVSAISAFSALATPAPAAYRSPYSVERPYAIDAHRPDSVTVSDGRMSAVSFYQQSPAPDFSESDHAHANKRQKTNSYQANVSQAFQNGDINGFNDFGNGLDAQMMDFGGNGDSFQIGEAAEIGEAGNLHTENSSAVRAPGIVENMEHVEAEIENADTGITFQDDSFMSLMPDSPSPVVMSAATSGQLQTATPPQPSALNLSMELPAAEEDSDLDAPGEPEVFEPLVAMVNGPDMVQSEFEALVEAEIEDPQTILEETIIEEAKSVPEDHGLEKQEPVTEGAGPKMKEPVYRWVISKRPDSSNEKPALEDSNPLVEDNMVDNVAPVVDMASDMMSGVVSSAQEAGTQDEQRESRSRSASTSSSLSEVSEHAIDGAFASAHNSPAVQGTKRTLLIDPATGIPFIGTGNANLFGVPVDQPVHRSPYGSPYTNAQTFSAVAETVVRKSAPKASRPINKPGPKFHTFSVTPSTSNTSGAAPPSSTNTPDILTNTSANDQPSTIPSMAPVVVSSSSSTLLAVKSGPTRFKIIKNSAVTKLQGRQVLDENDQASLMKRKARETAAANYKRVAEESSERDTVVAVSSQDVASQSDGTDFIQVAATKRPAKKQRKLGLKTKGRETRHSSARPNNYDSEEAPSSPTILGFHPHLAPGSTPSSRAATPSVSSRQPARKARTGTGLRVKSSPMKNKGTSAGIPRSGERNHSPIGNGISSKAQDGVENDDFCSACGGNGDLVCCDGRSCPRSFHFKCVDPPLIDDLPDEWYCNECDAPQRPLDDYKGAFRDLFFNLDSKCPRAFSLPAAIRDYFEDVKTGTEGEYEEIQPQKTKTPKGWEEPPDYFRLKDAKGNSIFCYSCGGQAEAPARSIINCTYCTLNWHMDCLPIPLAREPGPGRPWKCPAHVDDILTKLPDHLGPTHKHRRVKGSKVIRPYFARGMPNNGFIEIENDPSGAEDQPNFYVQKEFGQVYKLPELGIKLDFISKVKQSNAQFRRDVPNSSPRSRPSVSDWNSRSKEEQQAAMNLASMLMPSDQTTRLINTLIAEAPPTVVALIAHGSSDTIGKPQQMTKGDKQSITAAIEALQAKLAAAEGSNPGQVEGAMNGGEVDDAMVVEAEDEEMILS